MAHVCGSKSKKNNSMHVNIKGNFIFALPKQQSLGSTAIPDSGKKQKFRTNTQPKQG
jgi:hypothetical protein